MKSIAMVCVGLFAGSLLAAEPAQPAKAAAPEKAAQPAQQAQPAQKAAAKNDKKADAKKAGKLTLAQACERIPEVVKDPVIMGEITKELDAADQKQFLIEVNKAIVSMPGSNEQKTAIFLNVEREALLAAKQGNLQPMVATMFATVTLESLTVLAERYGEDLFNRDADSSKSFTDEQFTEIASSTVKEVADECKDLPDAAPRDTLAIYLFEKASNDTIPELEDRLLEVAFSDSETRTVAKNEWLAAAKNTESEDRFSALLGYADAGRQPNVDVVLNIAGPQLLTAALNDLAQCVVDSKGNQIMPVTQGESATGRDTATANQIVQSIGSGLSATQPKTSADVPWNPSKSREKVAEENPGGFHPSGYQFQE